MQLSIHARTCLKICLRVAAGLPPLFRYPIQGHQESLAETEMRPAASLHVLLAFCVRLCMYACESVCACVCDRIPLKATVACHLGRQLCIRPTSRWLPQSYTEVRTDTCKKRALFLTVFLTHAAAASSLLSTSQEHSTDSSGTMSTTHRPRTRTKEQYASSTFQTKTTGGDR